MSIVRENLMGREGYTPYCGNYHCYASMPRTRFNGSQFECVCGWKSSFEEAFIQEYKAQWECSAVSRRENDGT